MVRPNSSLTLVVGSESLFVERAIDSTVQSARRSDPETERRDIDATETGAIGELDQACSPTLFGGGAVVVVHHVEAASPEFVEALTKQAVSQDSPVPIVAAHAGGAKGKKVLTELAKIAAEQVDCGEIKRGRATQDFVASEMKRHSRSMSPRGRELLIAAVGTDVRALASACSQLASDIEGGEIDTDEVARYFGGTVEVSGFEIADAVMARRSAQALRLIRLAEGPDGGGGRLGPVTVSALVNSVRQLVAVSCADPGISDRDLAVKAKVPPWKLRTINEQLRRWNQMDLASAILLLADLDAATKGGLREGEQLDPMQK